MNHCVTEEELRSRELLRCELIEWMTLHGITNGDLAEHVHKSVGVIVAYRRGRTVLTPIVQNRLLTAIQEMVDHRKKPRGPIVLSEEEIQRRIDRRSILNDEMSKNNIDNKELATNAKLSKSMIEKFRDGSYSITKSYWEVLTTALEAIRLKSNGNLNAYMNNPVIIEKRCNHRTKHVDGYVFLNIQENGNAMITKKKFKGHETQVLHDLREFGYECTVRELADGSYVLEGRKINA